MKDEKGRTIRLRVYCGRCAAEKRRKPEELGHVVSDRDGWASWFVYDNRRRRLPNAGENLPDVVAQFGPVPGEEFLAGVPLVNPSVSHFRPQETLTTYCKNHGLGRVASSDVLNGSGSVVLDFIATA